MSISDRLWDDEGFASRSYGPPIVEMLLDELGLRAASPADQSRGIATWLSNHEPSPSLRSDLRVSRFADLLIAAKSA